jgi:uncharacterized protein (DUF362 family)
MQNAFSWLGSGFIKKNDRVFIKPNLTYPFYKKGITTSPEFIEAVVQLLAESTRNITIVESDGGSYAWPAERAMAGHNIPEICKKYSVRMLNLTKRPQRSITVVIDKLLVNVELSAEMLDECDLFITMPVPKVHAMTYLTLGFKNQWGCIPNVKRVRHHPKFAHKVLAVNKALRTRIAVFDGSYFLNRTGPMKGDPVKKNLVIASDGIGAGDLVCSKIMQIPPQRASHLKLAQKLNMMPQNLNAVKLNCKLTSFIKEKFYLQRNLNNWFALTAFHREFLTRLVYDSRFSKPIHKLLYALRGAPKDGVQPRW